MGNKLNARVEDVKNVLKQVKFDREAYNEFLKEFCYHKIKGNFYSNFYEMKVGLYDDDDTYNYIIEQYSHKSITVDKVESFNKDLEELLDVVYTEWHRYIVYNYVLGAFNEIDDEKVQETVNVIIEDLRNKRKLLPQTIRKSGYKKFFNSINAVLPKSALNMFYNQEFERNGFLHINSPFYNNKTNVRLYLNLKYENIVKFAKEFYNKCVDKNQDFYFKFASEDLRNDTFLVYTSYEKANDFIEIIREIKREKPYLFDGAEKINPLLGRIDGYIGFGEEPLYKHSSFNTERCIINDLCDKEIWNSIRKIINQNCKIRNRRGEELTFDEYLDYKIRQLLIENIDYKIKNGLIKDNFLVQNFIERLNNRQYYQKELSTLVQDYKYACDGLIIKNSISFEKLDESTETSMKLAYDVYKLNDKLLSKFEEEKENLFDRITDAEIQAKCFSSRHVCSKFPFLNTETEEVLKENKLLEK